MADRKPIRVNDASRGRLQSKEEETGGGTTAAPTMTSMDATEREKLGTVAGSGIGAKAGDLSAAPKQLPGESPAAFGARMRTFREKQRSSGDQATALRAKP